MRDEETATVTCRGSAALRRQWLADLARLLVVSPPPAAALLEGALDGTVFRVTVRPRTVVAVLARSAAAGSVELVEVPASAPAPPFLPSTEHYGVVVRSETNSDDRRAPLPPVVDRLGIPPALGRDSWLGLQTFWVPAGRGHLWLARRFREAVRGGSENEDRSVRTVGAAVAAEWALRVGTPATFRPGRWGEARDWARGGYRTIPPEGWFEVPAATASRSGLSHETAVGTSADPTTIETPAIVLGASGAGKTTFLARVAATRANAGESVVVLDLHGDLAPAIVARLSPARRGRVVAVDAGAVPVPGIAALVTNGAPDRAAAHLVAALKRLTPDGTELYWGFRLERVFDTFVRLALETGGSLVDVYDLLTNSARRDSARLATRSPELGQFLDELAPVVRRNPDFLWSAATRLSKVVLVPALRQLLAPEDGGIPVEALIAEHRPLLVRLPFTTLGPEAAGFAATLLLSRIYLGVAAGSELGRPALPVSVFLDEVHAFSPRLVSELLTEGRKFGVRPMVATQYPARLARELQAAARGALRGFVTFRIPRPSVPEVAAWFGVGLEEASELLPNLPPGHGLVRDGTVDGIRPIVSERSPPEETGEPWRSAVTVSQSEFVGPSVDGSEARETEPATERLLLAVLSATESGSRIDGASAVRLASALPGPSPDPALLDHRLPGLIRERFLEESPQGLVLTPAGERRLGLTTSTEAVRESSEHRALLLAAFRLFARQGYRLEIVRQGRFDTTLPDARFRQLTVRAETAVPAELAVELERVRAGWAWRFFRGRDVFVEAEVSGALRPERVRRGFRKAAAHGAYALFVVGDAARARRVRSALRAMNVGPDRAQVWTLRVGGVGPRGPARPNG